MFVDQTFCALWRNPYSTYPHKFSLWPRGHYLIGRYSALYNVWHYQPFQLVTIVCPALCVQKSLEPFSIYINFVWLLLFHTSHFNSCEFQWNGIFFCYEHLIILLCYDADDNIFVDIETEQTYLFALDGIKLCWITAWTLMGKKPPRKENRSQSVSQSFGPPPPFWRTTLPWRRKSLSGVGSSASGRVSQGTLTHVRRHTRSGSKPLKIKVRHRNVASECCYLEPDQGLELWMRFLC